MILHLLHDDKICNQIIDNFEEVFPLQNVYICFCEKDNLKYISESESIHLLGYSELLENDGIIKDIDKVIIHHLSMSKIRFVEQFYYLLKKSIIYWVFWGGDAYNEILYSKGYDIYYKKKYLRSEASSFKFKQYIRKMLKMPCVEDDINKEIQFIKEKVHYVVTSKPEFNLLYHYLGDDLNIKILDAPIYYPIESILGPLMGKKTLGCNIMIGNSASYTNNHFYAFDILKSIDTNGLDKVLPLSYSGDKNYIKDVIIEGRKLWGSSFKPIVEFMPLEKYNNLMLSINSFIYGNWRQEAIGNIVIALYLGAKVFVSKKSPLLEVFSNYGIQLYVLEEITSNMLRCQEPEDIVLHNRTAIMKIYSKSSILNNIKRFFS